MGALINPSVNAKLKAMYAKKLKKTDLDDLMKQEKIADAIILLKSKLESLKSLPISADRATLEASLESMITVDKDKIGRCFDGESEKIWQAYIKKYEHSRDYFDGFWNTICGKDVEIEAILGMQIDFLNILWTYRCSKYYGVVDENELIKHFSKIDLDVIREIENAKNVDDLRRILDSTKYKNVVKNDVELDFKRAIYVECRRIFRSRNAGYEHCDLLF